MKKTNKKDKKVRGDKTVTFWNLIRSYLLFHHPKGHALFIAPDFDKSNDFLHYSNCFSFASKEEMDENYQKLKKEQEGLIIRISEGIFLD